jgi:hypothetical protein
MTVKGPMFWMMEAIMIRYAGRVWSSLTRDYGIYTTALNVDQEVWVADFIHDAYVDKMAVHDVAFRIANEYGNHTDWLDHR